MTTTCLITGGTGSFGRAFTEFCLTNTDWDVRVLSRDEQKQDAMRRDIANPRVRYLLGDLRDVPRLERAIRGCDYVVHAAAFKSIPAGEYNPDEVIKTNIIGSHNVVEACVTMGVDSLICISSDKAVAPVNLYGHSKACMEKLSILANQFSGKTRIGAVRYGNVLGSRGSVLTFLKTQAGEGEIRITAPEMTRFWMSLDEACNLVFHWLALQEGGKIYIPKLRSAYVKDICEYLYPDVPIKVVGIRPGEKIHEWLTHEYEDTEDLGWCYQVNHGWKLPHKPVRSNDPELLLPASELLERYSKEVELALAP